MKPKIFYPILGFVFGWFVLYPLLKPSINAKEKVADVLTFDTDLSTTSVVKVSVTIITKSDYERGVEDAISRLSLVNLERTMTGTNWSFLQMSNIVKVRLMETEAKRTRATN